MAELDISGNSVQLDCSVDSGICVDVATKDLKMKLQEFKRILFILERDKEMMRLLRDRLSRIAERKSAKKKKDGQTVCNVCFTPIDTDDSKTCIACCSCAKNVCRGDKCSEWIPKEGEWQCQLCAAHRDSYGKASTWVEEQNAVKLAHHAEFSYGMRARSEIYIPVCDPNESAFLCNFESVSEAASPVHPIQKKHIREYIEEVLADMIGGSLESATVEPIAMTNGNYQQVRNGHELQGISNVRLRRLIESIIAETVRQPPFSSAGLIATTSIDSNDVGIDGREVLPMNGNGNICNGNGGQYFESKKYQDLLATAVLNKIVNTHGNGRHSESSPDLTTSSVLDNNHNALNLTKTDESVSSSSSVEPRSESSLTDPILNINKNDELSPNIKYEKFYDDAANDNIDADRESVLSDFISSHMVPLPHISTERASDDDEDDEDEDFISVTSSRDATWEDNWLFKKKKSNKTSSSVGMLVPAPKEDVRTLIGDKPTDEVSDLSEVGSDTDDSSQEMVSASLEPMNDRLVNKHLIGGKNTKVILDELVDRTSMISTSSLPDNVPPYTETKNEFVVSNNGLNESSQPLKISVNNCTKAISNEAINSNVSKPITVNKVEKHVKDTDGPEDESIVPPPNDFTDDEKMRNLLAKFNEEQNNKADSGDDNSSSLSPRSSISCALSAGIDRAELDAYEGITDFSVEDEEGLASEIDAPMGESSSRRPSVIEILAAIALGPMLAVSASDDRNILTEVELSSLMELNELAMAQMGSKSPEDRRLDVIAEESFDSNTPDERKMDFVDVNDEDDLLSSPKMVMDAIRELVGRDAVKFRRNEESSVQIEEITGISEDFIADCEIDEKEGCTITEIEAESAEEQLNVKAIEEEVQQPVPELKEEIAVEEINDNATVSLSEDLGFEKIIPDNTSSISDESLHTIGSSSDGSDFEGDTTCFSCDDTNTSIKDGNTVDEFILRPPTAFCDEQSRMDNECVATRAHINSDTVETNEQITTENETHTEETQIETVGNDDKAISNLPEDIKEMEKNVSIFETVVEVHHHSEERTEITGDNQNIPKPEEVPGDESQVIGGILETVNPETAQETPSSEAVSSAEVIDEKSPQENEIEGTKKEVDELHESAEETDGKVVIAPPPLRVLSEAQLNEDQLSSVKVSEEISTPSATGESDSSHILPVEESVSDKSTEEDKLQQQISNNLETNADSEGNLSGPDETAIGTQQEEQISEKVEGNEGPEVEVALNEQNVEHVSAEMSDIGSTPARSSGSQGLISENSNASSAPEKIETSDEIIKGAKDVVPNESESSKVSEEEKKEEVERLQEDRTSESQVLSNPIGEESLSVNTDQANKQKTEEVNLKEDSPQKEICDEVSLKQDSIIEETVAEESQTNKSVSANESHTNIGNERQAIDESDNKSGEQLEMLRTEILTLQRENGGPTQELNSLDIMSATVPEEPPKNVVSEELVETVKEGTIVNMSPAETTEATKECLDTGEQIEQTEANDNMVEQPCECNLQTTAQEVILTEKASSEESHQNDKVPCASESDIATAEESKKEDKIEAVAEVNAKEQEITLNLQAAAEIYSDNTPKTPQTADIASVQPMFIIADKTESKAQFDESEEENELITDSTEVKKDEDLRKLSEKEAEIVNDTSITSSEVEIVDKPVGTNLVEEKKGSANASEIETNPIEESSIPQKVGQELEEQTEESNKDDRTAETEGETILVDVDKNCPLQSLSNTNKTSQNETEQLENQKETEIGTVSVSEEKPYILDVCEKSETSNETFETKSISLPEEHLCTRQAESMIAAVVTSEKQNDEKLSETKAEVETADNTAVLPSVNEEIDKMEAIPQSVAEVCPLLEEPSTDVPEITAATAMSNVHNNNAGTEAEEKCCTLQTELITDAAETSETKPNEQLLDAKEEAATADKIGKTVRESETELSNLQEASLTNIVETTASLPSVDDNIVETGAKQNLDKSEKESIEPSSEQTHDITDDQSENEIIKTETEKESILEAIESSTNVEEKTVAETSLLPNVVETVTDIILVPSPDEKGCISQADGKNDSLNDEASELTNEVPIKIEPEADSKNDTPAIEKSQLEPTIQISSKEEETPVILTESSTSEEQISKVDVPQSDKQESALEKPDEVSNPQSNLQASAAEACSTLISELPTTVPDPNKNQSNNDNATKTDETTSSEKITTDILDKKKEEDNIDRTKNSDVKELITTNSTIEVKEEILNVKIKINPETSSQPNTGISDIGDQPTDSSIATESITVDDSTSVTPENSDVLPKTTEKDNSPPKVEVAESLQCKENNGCSTIDNVPDSSEEQSKVTTQEATATENLIPSIKEDKKVEEKEKCEDHVEKVSESSEDRSNEITVESEKTVSTDDSEIVPEKDIPKSAADISDDCKQNAEELNEEKTDLPQKDSEVDSLPVIEEMSAAQTDNTEGEPTEVIADAPKIEVVPNEIVDNIERTEPKLEEQNNEVVDLNSSNTNEEVVEADDITEVVKDESKETEEIMTLKITEDNSSESKKQGEKTEEAVIQNQDIEQSPVSSIIGGEIVLEILSEDKPADSKEVEKLLEELESEGVSVRDDKRITEEIAKVEVEIASEKVDAKTQEQIKEPARSDEVEKVSEEPQSQENSIKDETITEKVAIVEEADTKSEVKQLDEQEVIEPTAVENVLEELKATGTNKEAAKESEQETEVNITEKSDLDIKDDKESIRTEQEDESICESTTLQPKEEQKDETSDRKDDQNVETTVVVSDEGKTEVWNACISEIKEFIDETLPSTDDAKITCTVTGEDNVSTEKKIVEISEAPVPEVKEDCNPVAEPILSEIETVGAAEEVIAKVEEKKDDNIDTVSQEAKHDHLQGSGIEEKETQAVSVKTKDAPILKEEVQKEDNLEHQEQKEDETCLILKTDDEKIQSIANANTSTLKTDDEKIEQSCAEKEPKTGDVLKEETSNTPLSTSNENNVLTVPTECMPETDVTNEIVKNPKTSDVSKNETESQQCSSKLGDMEEKSAIVDMVDEQPATETDTSITLKDVTTAETISVKEDIKIPHSEESSAICHNVQQEVEIIQTEESVAMPVESVDVAVSEVKSEVTPSTEVLEKIEPSINVDESQSGEVNKESNSSAPIENASQTSNNNLVSDIEAIVQAEVQEPIESIQKIEEEISSNKKSSENLSFGTEASRSQEQETEVTKSSDGLVNEPTELEVVEKESGPVESQKNLSSKTECTVANNQEPQIEEVEKKPTDSTMIREEPLADDVIIPDSTAQTILAKNESSPVTEIKKEAITVPKETPEEVVLTQKDDSESGSSEAKGGKSQMTEPEVVSTNEREPSSICTEGLNKTVNEDVVVAIELALFKEGRTDNMTTACEVQEFKICADAAVEKVSENLEEMKVTPSNVPNDENTPKEKIQEEDLNSNTAVAGEIVVEIKEVSHIEETSTTEKVATQKKDIVKEGTTTAAEEVVEDQASPKADITEEISTEQTIPTQTVSKSSRVEELPAIEKEITKEIPIKEVEVNQKEEGTGTESVLVEELPAPETNITAEISTEQTIVTQTESTAIRAEAVEELPAIKKDITEEIPIKEKLVTQEEGGTGTEAALVEELPAPETNITAEISTEQKIVTQTESTSIRAEAVEELPAIEKHVKEEFPVKEIVVTQEEGSTGTEVEELPATETTITQGISTKQTVVTQTECTSIAEEAIEEQTAIEKDITEEIPIKEKLVTQEEGGTGTEAALVEELPAPETNIMDEISTEQKIANQTESTTTTVEAVEELLAIEKDSTESIPTKEIVVNQETAGTGTKVEELPAPETNITEDISIEQTAATQIESTTTGTEAVEELSAIEKDIIEQIPIKEIVVTQEEGGTGTESALVEKLPAPETNITEEISTEQTIANQTESTTTKGEPVEELPVIEKDIKEQIPIKEIEVNQEEAVTGTKVEELPAPETNITEEILTEQTVATQTESTTTGTEAVEEIPAIEKDITEQILIKEIVVTQEKGGTGTESALVEELPVPETNITEEISTEQTIITQTETTSIKTKAVEEQPAIEKDITEQIPTTEIVVNQEDAPETNITEEILIEQTVATEIESTTTGTEAVEELTAIEKDYMEEIPTTEKEVNQKQEDTTTGREAVKELPAPETDKKEETSTAQTAATEAEDITEEIPTTEIEVSKKEEITGPESQVVEEQSALEIDTAKHISTAQTEETQNTGIATLAEPVEELSAIEKDVTEEILITGKETTLKEQNTENESQSYEAEIKTSSSSFEETVNDTTRDAIVQEQTSSIVENTITNSEKASDVENGTLPPAAEKEVTTKDLLENTTNLKVTIEQNAEEIVQTPIPEEDNMPSELQQIQTASVIPETDTHDNVVDKKATETVPSDHTADSIIKKPTLLKGTAVEETFDIVDPVEKLSTEIRNQPGVEFSNTTENDSKIEVISSEDVQDKSNSTAEVIRELETIETPQETGEIGEKPNSKQNEPINQSELISDDNEHIIQEQGFESPITKEAEESDSECSFASASEELLEEFLVPHTKPEVNEELPTVNTEDKEKLKPSEPRLDETLTPVNSEESIQSNEKDIVLEDLSIVHQELVNVIESLQPEETISAPDKAELKEETRQEPSSDTKATGCVEEIKNENVPEVAEDPPDLKKECSSKENSGEMLDPQNVQEELMNVVESAQPEETILVPVTLTEVPSEEKETKITEETPNQTVAEVTEEPSDSKKEYNSTENVRVVINPQEELVETKSESDVPSVDVNVASDSNQETLKVDDYLPESSNPPKSTEEALENVEVLQTKAQDATSDNKSEELISSKIPNEVDSNKNQEEVAVESTSVQVNVEEKIEVSSESKEESIVPKLEVESTTSESLPAETTETKEEETVQIVEEVVSPPKEEITAEVSPPITQNVSIEVSEVKPSSSSQDPEANTPDDVCQKESNKVSVDSIQRNSSEQTSSEEVSVSSVVENKTLSEDKKASDEATVQTPIEVLTATCKIITHPPLEKTESLIASAQLIYEQISEPISESSPDLTTPNLAEELRIADDPTVAAECVTPQTISCESRCFASDPQPNVAQPTSDSTANEQHPNAQDSVQGKQTISQQARQQIFAQKSSRKPKANTINGSSNKFRNLTLQDRRFLAELEKRRKQRELIQNYLDSLDSIDIPNYINEDIYLFESTRNVKPKSSIEQSPYSLFIEPSDYCIVGATSRTSLPNAKTHFLKTKNILFSDRISSDSNRTDEDDDNNSTTTVIDTFGSMDCQLSSNSNSCEDFSPDDLSSTDRDSSATATTATNSILSTNNATTNQSHIKSQPLQPQPELRTESACSKLLVETRPTGGNEEHVDDDPLKHLVPGSIAEREYKKWYNAVDMPNNPYSVEALRRRLSDGPDRVLDLPNISPCVEDKPLPICENTSAEADMKTQEKDYARYSRDYYINDAKHASGITKKSATSPTEIPSPTPTASSIELEERDDSTPKIPTSTPVKEMCHKLEKQGRIDTDLYLATPVRVIEDIPEVFAEAVGSTTPTVLTTEAVSKLSSETSSILTNASLTPSEDSDTIRIYDLKKQETRLVKETTHTTTITVPKSTEKKLRPTELDITPTLAAPIATVSAKSSTPTSFKFLQPKRKLINPSQVLSIDNDAPPTTPSVSEKPVIEEEVVHALPSVKALAKAFLMTSTTTTSSSDNKWRKARAKSPLQFFKLTTSATPAASGSKIVQKQLEPVHIPVVPVDTASQGSEDATIASDLSSLETDPPSRIDAIETTENQERVVLSGCLRNNIAFFENLKNK